MKPPTTLSESTETIPSDASDVFQCNPTFPYRKWFQICEWMVLVLLFAQIGVRTAPKAWRTLNTDFPNYYLTARLAHEHYDLSRIYEWVWFERQKDRRDIDQRIVEMVPITPFSTLAVYP